LPRRSDPESENFESGTSVTEFGIACNRSVKKGDEWEDVPSFFEVKVWGGRGDLCARKLHKGSFVTVFGRLDQERWETADGEKRSKVVIVAQQVEGADFFVKGGDAPAAQPQAAAFAPAAPDDDIPF